MALAASETDLLDLVEAMARASSEDDLLADLAFRLQHLSGAGACDILTLNAHESLVLRATTSAPEYNGRVKLGKGVGVCGVVIASGEAVIMKEGASKHPNFAKCPGIDDQNSEAIAVIPLIFDARIDGVLVFRWEQPQSFP